MGFGEAFRANINQVKSLLSKPLAMISSGGADLMQKTSESGLGSTAVAAGGGILAALLAGRGLGGIGGALGAGVKGAAAQAVTGKEVQPVYVVNAAEIGGGGAGQAAGALAGAGGMLGKVGRGLGAAGAVAGAGAAGYAVGSLIEPYVTKGLDKFQTEGAGGQQMNVIEKFFDKLDQWTGGSLSGVDQKYRDPVQVEVRSFDPGLKAKAKQNRGAAQ